MSAFVILDLCERAWSVTWPGFEMVVCDNERKATNLLRILFDEVEVEDAVLAVKVAERSKEDFTITIPWMTYHQNPESAGGFLVRNHSVVGCKFFVLEQAEKFKVAMEKRLAWYRLSGGRKWE